MIVLSVIPSQKLRTNLATAGVVLAGLAAGGCAASSPAPKTASAGTRSTSASVATNGTVKGHWVEESTPQTGSHIKRRFFVPDGTSEEAAAAAAGAGAPVESSKPGVRESTRTFANGLRQG